MRINVSVILVITIYNLFLSCSDGQQKTSLQNDKIVLLNFSNAFVMNDGHHADGYYKNRDEFIQPYKSYRINNDTIYVSTLLEVNACGEKIGKLFVSKDTISLKTEAKGDLCASIEFHKCFYTIKVDSAEKYIISF